MAQSTQKKQTKQDKLIQQEEKHRRLLESLGFVQLMFDFYTAPVG